MTHTDDFIYATEVYTNGNDEEKKAMYKALETALAKYQWYYQNASEKKFVTVDNQTRKAIDTVLKLLHDQGHYSLIGEVEYALDIDKSTLTKSKVLTKVKRILKAEMLKCESIKLSRYKDDLAELMCESFIEHCEVFPLDKAPETMDMHFTPWIDGEDMSK
jgi:hypothetical protein